MKLFKIFSKMCRHYGGVRCGSYFEPGTGASGGATGLANAWTVEYPAGWSSGILEDKLRS